MFDDLIWYNILTFSDEYDKDILYKTNKQIRELIKSFPKIRYSLPNMYYRNKLIVKMTKNEICATTVCFLNSRCIDDIQEDIIYELKSKNKTFMKITKNGIVYLNEFHLFNFTVEPNWDFCIKKDNITLLGTIGDSMFLKSGYCFCAVQDPFEKEIIEPQKQSFFKRLFSKFIYN